MAYYTSDPESFPEPIDLSHHLSRSTKAREASSVKRFYKYFSIPGIAQLAGGESHSLVGPSGILWLTAQGYQTTSTFPTTPSKPESPTPTDGSPRPTSPSTRPPTTRPPHVSKN